jgi:hypothetical protein
MTSDEDFTLLDDPEFLAERKRVREALEYAPEASAELTGRYEKLSEEFLRRARAAWEVKSNHGHHDRPAGLAGRDV